MKPKKGKQLLIALLVVVIVAGAGFGAWYYMTHRTTEPVPVFPFQYIGMTEYWGDSQESYGPVSTDRVQTIFVSDTQEVTEILVQAGDTVKKGDLLMTFDTTLSDINLERQRLELEKLKLQLENAQDELKAIKKMKPMVIPAATTPKETQANKGVELSGNYQISQNKTYDGSSKEKSLILWLKDSASLDDDLFEAVRKTAETYQKANAPVATEPVVPPAEKPVEESTAAPSEEPTAAPTEEPTAAPTEESTAAPTEEPTVAPTEESTAAPTEEPTVAPTEESTVAPTEEPTVAPTEESTVAPTEEPTTVPTEPVPELNVKKFYMVVKITQGNMSLGYNTTWQGIHVTKTGSGFQFKFFDAGAVTDHMTPQQTITTPSTPQIDFGSGYTSAQLAQMRADQEKEIKDLEFRIKMAEAEYAIKQTEAETGQVFAEIDGVVVSLIGEEDARESMQPIMKISGGGGFYVEVSVSELEKDRLQAGQEVTVYDWNTGMEYIGTVHSIGDFPTAEGYWNGIGNPNASYYPFKVFIDESADLQSGSYVNVVYSTATTQQGIYLENPFLRTEQGVTYVYVRGSDGKLEKRAVTVGKSLWGSYTEILDGLTAEDYIAFPYGKTVIHGADTLESDMSVLYG